MERPDFDDPKFAQKLFEKWIVEKFGVDTKSSFAQNDWTRIIKMHALIETALNGALVLQFESPELASVIAKLDTSNTATGKVAFAKALKILPNPSVVFIQRLSELRNYCVHDIRNFDFSLLKYFDALTDQRRQELLKALSKMNLAKYSLSKALLMGTIMVLMQIAIHQQECEKRDRHRRIASMKLRNLTTNSINPIPRNNSAFKVESVRIGFYFNFPAPFPVCNFDFVC